MPKLAEVKELYRAHGISIAHDRYNWIVANVVHNKKTGDLLTDHAYYGHLLPALHDAAGRVSMRGARDIAGYIEGYKKATQELCRKVKNV